MRIFMSWSGSRSKAIAAALTEWIQMVVQSAEPWMSDKDLAKGARSIIEIGSQLEASNVGVVCLTPENIADQWINFEAGALSKSYGGAKVWTYLYGLDYSQVTGPLAQFQHTKAEKTDTLKLVMAINDATEKKMEPARLETLFDALWPKLEEKLKNIPATVRPAPLKRPPQDIAEENLELTRGLAKAIDTLRNELGEHAISIREVLASIDSSSPRWINKTQYPDRDIRYMHDHISRRIKHLDEQIRKLEKTGDDSKLIDDKDRVKMMKKLRAERDALSKEIREILRFSLPVNEFERFLNRLTSDEKDIKA